MARKHHPLDDLPFTAIRDGKKLPKPVGDQVPRCFWHVNPTGNYGADCQTGTQYALQYLDFLENDNRGTGCLPHIVADMPRDLSGIEVAFLELICFQAQAGTGRAKQVANYWSAERAELAVAL